MNRHELVHRTIRGKVIAVNDFRNVTKTVTGSDGKVRTITCVEHIPYGEKYLNNIYGKKNG